MSVYKLALWDFVGRFASYGVSFATGIVLARILTPEEFGVYGLLVSVIAISAIFLDFGFRTAIVQASEVTQTQLSSVFFLNLAFGLIIAGVIMAASGLIAGFYDVPSLSKLLSVLSSTFVFNAVASVPSGLLQRDLRMRELSAVALVAALIGGAVGITMATQGYGVWSLVASNIALSAATMLGSLLCARWLPILEFNTASVRPLWQFGSKMFGSTVLETLFTRIEPFLIPRLFGVATLGHYTRAQSIDSIVRTFSASSIVSVMFPVFARNQNDLDLLKQLYLRALNMIGFVSFAVSGTLAVAAVDLVLVLFSSQWVEAAVYFQIMAITSFVYPTSALMVNLVAARGNSRAFLILELLKKGTLLPAFTFLFVSGVQGFLVAIAVGYIVCLLLNMLFVRREIQLEVRRQVKTLIGYLIIAAGAAGLSRWILEFFAEPYFRVAVGMSSFIVTYLLLNLAFRTSATAEIWSKVKPFLNDKRNSDISTAA
jgi:O-antigen/teichoic acid export membrane protein